MLGHREVLCRIRRHKDDTPAGVQMPVSLASDEKLASRVEREDAVKLFLGSSMSVSAPESRAKYTD